jgi:hypothetical protein
MQDILYPIIEHYIGTRVARVKRDDESVLFKTMLGQGGRIEKNIEGDCDLVINEEKVGEIEDILFSIFCEAKDQPPIEKYYEKLLQLKEEHLNARSTLLVDQLLLSIEFLILNMEIELKNPVDIGPFYIFNYKGEKQILVLN